jgi:hypothetical protein
MAGSLAPHSACPGALAPRQLHARAARSLAVAPRAIAAVEAPPSKSSKPSKPDGVMGQGPIIINGQVRAKYACEQWRSLGIVEHSFERRLRSAGVCWCLLLRIDTFCGAGAAQHLRAAAGRDQFDGGPCGADSAANPEGCQGLLAAHGLSARLVVTGLCRRGAPPCLLPSAGRTGSARSAAGPRTCHKRHRAAGG